LAAPEISVVIPSHGRLLRLWWLLNALEEQRPADLRFEVIVVHDYAADDAATLARHPLADKGVLRLIEIPPGTGNPARQRNIGWRAAEADFIAFTDDDCRPDTGWLSALMEARNGEASIVQGSTEPDPLEILVSAAPHHRSLQVTPPNYFLQTCNIGYPRPLLERLAGFDEAFPTAAGEDTDLGLRAREAGAKVVAAERARVFHAVESLWLGRAVISSRKWEHLPYIVQKHPGLRRKFTLGVFWRPAHAELLLAALGLATARRTPVAAALALPYLRRRLGRRGWRARGLLASTMELPGQAAVDLAEILTLVRGSVRYRTPML
jgi:GT2 family glycosyltransferase